MKMHVRNSSAKGRKMNGFRKRMKSKCAKKYFAARRTGKKQKMGNYTRKA